MATPMVIDLEASSAPAPAPGAAEKRANIAAAKRAGGDHDSVSHVQTTIIRKFASYLAHEDHRTVLSAVLAGDLPAVGTVPQLLAELAHLPTAGLLAEPVPLADDCGHDHHHGHAQLTVHRPKAGTLAALLQRLQLSATGTKYLLEKFRKESAKGKPQVDPKQYLTDFWKNLAADGNVGTLLWLIGHGHVRAKQPADAVVGASVAAGAAVGEKRAREEVGEDGGKNVEEVDEDEKEKEEDEGARHARKLKKIGELLSPTARKQRFDILERAVEEATGDSIDDFMITYLMMTARGRVLLEDLRKRNNWVEASSPRPASSELSPQTLRRGSSALSLMHLRLMFMAAGPFAEVAIAAYLHGKFTQQSVLDFMAALEPEMRKNFKELKSTILFVRCTLRWLSALDGGACGQRSPKTCCRSSRPT
jgi:hypothetical protein